MPDQPLTLTIAPELLERLAQRVAQLVHEQAGADERAPSPWLDFEAARAYLGFSRDRLYKLTAARAIPCRKKADGQGLYFYRAELDAWMDAAYPRLDRLG